MKIQVVHIILAVPEGSTTYMDILSDARDWSNGSIVEWAKFRNRPDYVAEGESEEMLALFDSHLVSPQLLARRRSEGEA